MKAAQSWGHMAQEAPSKVISSDEVSKCKTCECRDTGVKLFLTQHSIFAILCRTVVLERL